MELEVLGEEPHMHINVERQRPISLRVDSSFSIKAFKGLIQEQDGIALTSNVSILKG